jgi:hypothetical protein
MAGGGIFHVTSPQEKIPRVIQVYNIVNEDLKSSPVQIGGFEMTSHTNISLLKVR